MLVAPKNPLSMPSGVASVQCRVSRCPSAVASANDAPPGAIAAIVLRPQPRTPQGLGAPLFPVPALPPSPVPPAPAAPAVPGFPSTPAAAAAPALPPTAGVPAAP